MGCDLVVGVGGWVLIWWGGRGRSFTGGWVHEGELTVAGTRITSMAGGGFCMTTDAYIMTTDDC